MTYLDEYQNLLHQALFSQGTLHLVGLADKRLCGQLMKSFSPARARAFVASAAIAQARQDLRGLVGKVSSDVLAVKEAELNRMAARLS